MRSQIVDSDLSRAERAARRKQRREQRRGPNGEVLGEDHRIGKGGDVGDATNERVARHIRGGADDATNMPGGAPVSAGHDEERQREAEERWQQKQAVSMDRDHGATNYEEGKEGDESIRDDEGEEEKTSEPEVGVGGAGGEEKGAEPEDGPKKVRAPPKGKPKKKKKPPAGPPPGDEGEVGKGQFK